VFTGERSKEEFKGAKKIGTGARDVGLGTAGVGRGVGRGIKQGARDDGERPADGDSGSAAEESGER